MPKILDGKKLAQEIELILQQAIESGLEVAKRRPGLAVLRVGNDPASGVYVNYKEKACDRIGVRSFARHLKADISLEELREIINSLNKEENVIWWGYEADESKRIALLQIAEVFLLPSLVEGLSIALLEAMATGTACVATDAGADGEVLENGAGIILNTEGVTSQLRTLLPVLRDQPVLTNELGRRARLRVEEKYTLQQNIDSLENLYTNVLNSYKSKPLQPIDDSSELPRQLLQLKRISNPQVQDVEEH